MSANATVSKRIIVECSWCLKKQMIPEEMCGKVMKCMNCRVESRAYGYLSAPAEVEKKTKTSSRREIQDDGNGGIFKSLFFVIAYWAVVIAIILFWWV